MPRRVRPERPDQLGLGLPDEGDSWPDHDRFPYNFGGKTVGGRLVADLSAGDDALLVAGYASLEELLDLFDRVRSRPGRTGEGYPHLRVLLGSEPFQTGRPVRKRVAVHQDIFDYWLESGISLLRSPEVFGARALLDEGCLEVRASGATRVHAKVYVTSTAATLGSSNYTFSGLRRNQEANVRFEAGSEPRRHTETSRLGEAIWRLGDDFQQGFRDLLDSLLRKVTWKEALARACAELLEGEWARPTTQGLDQAGPPLWPSQEQGVAQALWVLENAGSVLVADATGSGKTRLGASLLRALQDRSWSAGRTRGRLPVLVCPPILRTGWRRELAQVGEAVTVFSHGVLSQRGAERRSELEETLGRAQILAVDEAHNFLNQGSQRSRLLYGNVADHVVLLTATPINKGASDLLALVDLLGADNFDESVLDILARLGRRRSARSPGGPSGSEVDMIRGALQHFVVRRTKTELNQLVDRDPERYVNVLGKRCRFPEHEPVVFRRDPPRDDRARAAGIREKARNLRGLINFQKPIRLPAVLRYEGWDEVRFLETRLAGSAALASYQARSRLRSSRVALTEHILGTREACSLFGLKGAKAAESPGIVNSLERLSGHPPRNQLGIAVPDWLADPVAHERAIEEEIETYRDINRLADQMSDQRQEENARYLMGLLDRHPRIIAFDSHLISLYALRKQLRIFGSRNVALATGEGGLARRRAFSRRFALEATEEGVIGLCSDALAEGLNLQGASAVVHLDMPSVIRVLEQRIGRVDRMDTSFDKIEVHWPDEPREFSLSSDERLFWRLREVEDLLGSNVPLPQGMGRGITPRDAVIPVEEVIKAVEESPLLDSRDTLADAFTEVRGLVQGSEALVDGPTYEALRTSKARVLSSVAVVKSERPWVFLAIGGADRSAPRWALVDLADPGRTKPEVSVDVVARAMRERLAGAPADIDFGSAAAVHLTRALQVLSAHERMLLPRRKQRALEEMEAVLLRYEKQAAAEPDPERRDVTRSLLHLLRVQDGHSTDVGRLADWWLEVLRPIWYEHLIGPKVRRPARLKHLRKKLLAEPITTERLASFPSAGLEAVPLDRRVVACVVGVDGAA